MSTRSDNSDEGGDGPSSLEYARQNGLCRDHLSEPLPVQHIEMLQGQTNDCIIDDTTLCQFELTSEFSTDERLTVSKEAAGMLASIAKGQTAGSIAALMLSLLGSKDIKSMRIEPPLLESDHEEDYRIFAKRSDFEISLEDVKLPLEIVDEDNDEGLGWPTRFLALHTETMISLKQERLEVKRETLMYFKSIMNYSWTDVDQNNMWDNENRYRRFGVQNQALESITPPLSPISPQPKLYEPSLSSPTFQLPILSDPESLTIADLGAIEKGIFEQDLPTPIREAISNKESHKSNEDCDIELFKRGEIYSPLASLDNTTGSPNFEIQTFKWKDLKVEEPLIPLKTTTEDAKSVHVSEHSEEIDIYMMCSPRSETYEMKFFEEAFGAAAETTKQRVEQEALIGADSLSRVEVPTMDFSPPNPPWANFQQYGSSNVTLSIQKAMVEETVAQGIPLWPGAKKLQTRLRWSPFPTHLAKVALEDDFDEDDSTWQVFVKVPEDDEVTKSSTLTWKPPGLRILKDDEDDDEVGFGKFRNENSKSMSSLVKKRKMEIEEHEISQVEQARLKAAKGDSSITVTDSLRQTQTKSHDFISAAQKLQVETSMERGLLLGGPFSAGKALDNFLELRGSSKQKLVNSSYFATSTENHEAKQIIPSQQDSLELPIRKSPVGKSKSVVWPEIRLPITQTYAIVSSALLKQRTLITRLEKVMPSLVLIERDFTAHNSICWLPKSVTRSPISSPLASEADLIVSQSTGIVLTTLQKIKQKPLPGQKTKSPIRSRIEKVSPRYEKLIVLVSEGRQDETTSGLDNSDCLALNEFMGFAAGVDLGIIVYFVGGGEEALSKWLVSLIIQNRVTDEAHLVEEETHWELFLRRAGMNVFAAQTVIAALKAPAGVDTGSPTKAGQFGLVAFVEMGKEERIARFETVVGAKVLEMVSAVVDGRWG